MWWMVLPLIGVMMYEDREEKNNRIENLEKQVKELKKINKEKDGN